jgi:hypothetical protein
MKSVLGFHVVFVWWSKGGPMVACGVLWWPNGVLWLTNDVLWWPNGVLWCPVVDQ